MGARLGRPVFFQQKRRYNMRSREHLDDQPGSYTSSQDITETSSEASNTDKRISKFELCRCDTISNASDVIENTATVPPKHVRESTNCSSKHGCDSDNCGSVHGCDSDTCSYEHCRDTLTDPSEHCRNTVTDPSEYCRDTLTDTSEHKQMAASDITENSRDSVSGDSVCDRDSRTDASELDRNSLECLAKESKVAGGDSSKVCDHDHTNEGDPSKAVIRNIGRNRRSQPYVCSRLSYMLVHGQMSQDMQPDVIQWMKGDRLGRGGFGTVWQGLTATGELIAVKQVQMNDFPDAQKEYEKIMREVSLLRMLYHRNIVRYLGSSFDKGIVSIFMQYAAGGSLDSILRKFGPLGETITARYTLQLLLAIAYLHDKHIVHRDIKSGNVMLTPDGVIKLIDFGCAKKIMMRLSRFESAAQKSFTGTPYWMAPEVIKESGHGRKSDIWSLGCTVFEMLTGLPPWGDHEPVAAIYAIGSDDADIPVLPDTFSEAAINFIHQCLLRDKLKRPNASSLLQHTFVTERKPCLAETEQVTANFVEVARDHS